VGAQTSDEACVNNTWLTNWSIQSQQYNRVGVTKMLRRRPDLESDLLSRQTTTTEEVQVTDRVGLDQPAISMRHERSMQPDGFLDQRTAAHAICACCGAVLQNETLGAVCGSCGQVLCEECASRRCAICGASLCAAHSITVGDRTFCLRHFLFVVIGWFGLLATITGGLAAAVYYLWL